MAESPLDVDPAVVAEIARRYGIARLEVFGSVSRGDDRADSDVDLLYDLAPGASLGWFIEDLVDELERVMGRQVDLVSRRALHPRLRGSVLSQARVIYAA